MDVLNVFILGLLVFGFSYGAAEVRREITEGDNATFTCVDLNSTDAISGVEFVFIKFAHESNTRILNHVAFIHRTAFTRSEVVAEQPFENRLIFSSAGQLTLTNSTVEDSGIFECSAFASDMSRFSLNTMNLEVEPAKNLSSNGANIGMIVGIVILVIFILLLVFLLLLKRTSIMGKSRDRLSKTRDQIRKIYRSMRVDSTTTAVVKNPDVEVA